MSTFSNLENEARVIASKFATEWGVFTRTLVAHPKTVFFGGVIVSGVIGFLIGRLF